MRKKVIYIGFYDIENNSKPRFCNIAAVKKMDYIIDSIQRAGFELQLISPSWLTLPMSFEGTKKVKLSENAQLISGPSISLKGKIFQKFTRTLSLTWLFFWLIINVKQKNKILVYHSPLLSLPVFFAKKIKGFKIALEIEEIYGSVWNISKINRIKENLLINNSDYFFPASNLLAKRFGDKVVSIIYGDYRFKNYEDKKNIQGYVNIVYAGSIDKTKSGAFTAAECAKYLPENFIVHIAGYGDKKNTNLLLEQIDKINKGKQREVCIFHGLLNQKELSKLLIDSDIAINPQKIGGYMDTAFPSKILVYLTHNLLVVSTKVRSIIESDLASLILFVDDADPILFAEAIKNVDFRNSSNLIKILNQLDNNFIESLKKLYKD